MPRADTAKTKIVISDQVFPILDVGELQEAVAVGDVMELPATLTFPFCSGDGVDPFLQSWLGVDHLHGSFSLVGHRVVCYLTEASSFRMGFQPQVQVA